MFCSDVYNSHYYYHVLFDIGTIILHTTCVYCIVSILFYFIVSALINDPGNICAETNGGLHVLPGETVTLQCVVNNTGATQNLLIWNTPVSKS